MQPEALPEGSCARTSGRIPTQRRGHTSDARALRRFAPSERPDRFARLGGPIARPDWTARFRGGRAAGSAAAVAAAGGEQERPAEYEGQDAGGQEAEDVGP